MGLGYSKLEIVSEKCAETFLIGHNYHLHKIGVTETYISVNMSNVNMGFFVEDTVEYFIFTVEVIEKFFKENTLEKKLLMTKVLKTTSSSTVCKSFSVSSSCQSRGTEDGEFSFGAFTLEKYRKI